MPEGHHARYLYHVILNSTGGDGSRWRRDGTEIFSLAPDNKRMAAAVKRSICKQGVGGSSPPTSTNFLLQRSAHDQAEYHQAAQT